VGLVRRGQDPVNGAGGPSNAVVPVLGGSHHYQDVNTVLGNLNGYSQATAIPHTLSHVHNFHATLHEGTTVDDVITLFNSTPRIRVIQGKQDGLTDTAKIAEWYKDMGRLRGDHPEVTIWEEGTQLRGNQVYILFDVHMESIPIPENMDAVRALTEREENAWESARMTDQALDSYLPGFAKEGKLYVPVIGRIN
jgi:glyceraldehyde-3-phosphate dehydrogenase (NAD(P))